MGKGKKKKYQTKPCLSDIKEQATAEAYKRQCDMRQRPLEEIKAEIRSQVASLGTNVDQNDSDPTGDGDQSDFGRLDFAGRQYYRDLWAYGGDIITHFDRSAPLSFCIRPFVLACVRGDVETVKASLELADRPGTPPAELIELLETRETSMRLSPLLFIAAVGKKMDPDKKQSQLAVARLLLLYGARPDAKDLVGKTVCHYGAGTMSTDMTVGLVDLCVGAAASCHLFGRQAELAGLQNRSMNGKRGIVRGYHTTNGRRAFYVDQDRKTVAVKPENILLVGDQQQGADPLPKLCDIQDRLGSVCLHELVMSNNASVAEHMLTQHGAAINVADLDGFSPWSMTTNGFQSSPVGQVIMKHAMKRGHAAKQADKRTCSQCGVAEGTNDKRLSDCSGCHSVQFCSKKCQVAHWKAGHKLVCKEMDAKRKSVIVLERPPEIPGVFMLSNATGDRVTGSSYRRPDHVAAGEQFYVKVQADHLDASAPMLVYDKTRQCNFFVRAKTRGARELYNEVRREKTTGGRKAYFKASFNKEGDCVVFPATMTLKAW